jgi:hypothetical protein
MLGIFLIYFIGKAFYDLAAQFNKSKWGYGILGIASYYLGTFIGGVLIGIGYELGFPGSIDDHSDIVLSLMGLPFGVLSCWGTYRILKSQFNKLPKFSDNKALDSDLTE